MTAGKKKRNQVFFFPWYHKLIMKRGNCALYVVFLDYKQQKPPPPTEIEASERKRIGLVYYWLYV